MAMPYQFRDYPLVWYMAVVVGLVACAHSAPPLQAVELKFDQPCCVTSPCPVVSVLARLPAVSDLKHVADDDGTRLTLRTAKAISPRELWTIVAAAHRPPQRMTVDRETFTAGSFH